MGLVGPILRDSGSVDRPNPTVRRARGLGAGNTYILAGQKNLHRLDAGLVVSPIAVDRCPYSFRVPVSASCSRNASSSVVRGSTSTVWAWPLTVRFTSSRSDSIGSGVGLVVVLVILESSFFRDASD